jgi:predicted transcriptional regulator
MLSLFPGIRFLSRYKDYFLSHDLSFLPKGYVERIGELSAGDYVNHLSLVLEHIKTVISKGREYVWLISDQPIVVGASIGTSFFSRDLPVRLIGEQTIDRKVLTETKSALSHSEIAGLQEVKIAMAINETFAGVCFPGTNGKIDFSAGFSGKDPQFRAWCCDLFEHYWAKSKKLELF